MVKFLKNISSLWCHLLIIRIITGTREQRLHPVLGVSFGSEEADEVGGTLHSGSGGWLIWVPVLILPLILCDIGRVI